ncbi:MAG: hypothetical protein ABSG19_13855 [Candidatus Aminicenantales bacterium]
MTRNKIVFPLILAAVAAFAAAGLAKDIVVTSQWSASPVRIDGLEQDWQDATFLTDEGSKAQYAVKNDGTDLYILFVFKDQLSATTIDYTGMKVYFGAEGKKSKDLGILFIRKPMAVENVIAEMEKRGETLTEERKTELRKQKTYMVFTEEVINSKKVTAPSDPAVQTLPPVYRAANNKRVAVYEFRIPLSRVNQPGGIGSEPGKTIKLGFEWGGMTTEIMKNVMADRAASGAVARQGASAMSTRDTSGEGEGGGGDFQGFNRDPHYKKHSFWIDLKLAGQ